MPLDTQPMCVCVCVNVLCSTLHRMKSNFSIEFVCIGYFPIRPNTKCILNAFLIGNDKGLAPIVSCSFTTQLCFNCSSILNVRRDSFGAHLTQHMEPILMVNPPLSNITIIFRLVRFRKKQRENFYTKTV